MSPGGVGGLREVREHNPLTAAITATYRASRPTSRPPDFFAPRPDRPFTDRSQVAIIPLDSRV
jgi:hypothetical protein